jgi:hypothetical protein
MREHEDDSDWTPIDWVNECSDEEDSEIDCDALPPVEFDSDDDEWCFTASTMQTWKVCGDLQTKRSIRVKYQLKPLLFEI